MLEVRLISALEKVLPDTAQLDVAEIKSDVAARGELYSFQIALRSDERKIMRIESASELNTRIRVVKYVPALYAGSGVDKDVINDNKPGLYPDLLDDPDFGEQFRLLPRMWQCLWVTVYVGKDQTPARYPIKVALRDMETNEIAAEPEFELQIMDFELLPQTMTNFHWFHVDCLYDYYKVPCWSEDHWQIIENFARNACDHGVTMLYTPLWTPPLDTAIGHSRPECQLLDITLDLSTLTYTFNFDRLRRYIELGQRIGFKQFGMSHLFTQWGAKACPKIRATLINADKSIATQRYGAQHDWKKFVSDHYTGIFGWNIESTSQEYADFLKQLFPALLPVLREYGLGKENCFFSLSDEPHDDHLETYSKCVEMVRIMFF